MKNRIQEERTQMQESLKTARKEQSKQEYAFYIDMVSLVSNQLNNEQLDVVPLELEGF
jgi:hypothetical protein